MYKTERMVINTHLYKELKSKKMQTNKTKDEQKPTSNQKSTILLKKKRLIIPKWTFLI